MNHNSLSSWTGGRASRLWFALSSTPWWWRYRSTGRSCSWSLNEKSFTCIASEENNFFTYHTAGVTPARARLTTILFNAFPKVFLHGLLDRNYESTNNYKYGKLN